MLVFYSTRDFKTPRTGPQRGSAVTARGEARAEGRAPPPPVEGSAAARLKALLLNVFDTLAMGNFPYPSNCARCHTDTHARCPHGCAATMRSAATAPSYRTFHSETTAPSRAGRSYTASPLTVPSTFGGPSVRPAGPRRAAPDDGYRAAPAPAEAAARRAAHSMRMRELAKCLFDLAIE